MATGLEEPQNVYDAKSTTIDSPIYEFGHEHILNKLYCACMNIKQSIEPHS